LDIIKSILLDQQRSGKIIAKIDNMPIFLQQDIDEDTRIAIWKIEEEASFFLKKVQPQRNVSHPHKNLQHLAGRYLLRYLFPDFPVQLIQIADTRKPYLEDEAYHFSISHCGNFAAAIVSRTNRVGLDAELYSEKVERIRHKFLGEKEMELLNNNSIEVNKEENLELELIDTKSQTSNFKLQTANFKLQTSNQSQISNLKLVSAWCCKEAVFKWYGKGGVDFKNHMEIKASFPYDENAKRQETIVLFKKNEELFLHLHSIFFDELCLSYVIT
jgi:phosphopantetheinyl transferase